MPARVVLNVAYTLLVRDLDAKQRRDLDSEIYGLGEIEARANKALFDQREDGGES